MCDFNNLDDALKAQYHQQLLEYANAFGGKNFFLQLLEVIRKTKPHPLIAKNSEFRFSRGTVKWGKVIFKDKLTLLLDIRVNESKNGTLLPDKEDKKYKKVMNLLRTLGPIEFEVMPKHLKDGDGFTIKPFEIIDENTTRLNPIFDAIFFCSVDTIKKVLNYELKS
ncbi:MAG: hypothetical protein U9R50_10400 [Campylobacterota bacterium]|nr:hypothetical protein [Campylobacterota bacterium]